MNKRVSEIEAVTIKSGWSGSVFLWRKRVLFVGEAGTSEDQAVHAIKICVALRGKFELSVDSAAKTNRVSAVIINAGIKHTVICNGAKIFLIYLLPETDEAVKLRQEYLNNGHSGVYEIPKELIDESLPLPKMRRNYLKRDCRKASAVCDEVIRGLGKIRRKPLSTSSAVNESFKGHVQQVIEYIYDNIYSETDIRLRRRKISKEQFTTSAISRKLRLKEDVMKRRFKEKVGISIEHFFRDIQLLSALRQYAIEAMDEGMDSETLHKKIAASVGCSLTLLDHRISSRLGINLSVLKDGSNFFACNDRPEKS